jgi:hypothetical protein
MSNPTYSATNCTNPVSIQVSQSHGAPYSVAMVECESFSGDIGSVLEAYMGYDGSNTRKFTGYVKEIQRKVPDKTWSITAYDKLVRGVDFMLVSANPEAPFTRSNIKIEDLVRDLLVQAGLTDFATTSSYYTVAVHVPVEIDMVGVYDYCKNIADMMSWSIWCDENGVINFKNRKPFVMDGSTGEIGDTADTPLGGYTITNANTFNYTFSVDEKNLRNRVVVRGGLGIYSERSDSSPWLPSGFYKTAAIGAGTLIDTQTLADQVAEINLNRFNHLTESFECTVEGSPLLSARQVITVNDTINGITGNFYVYTCNQVVSKQGYVVQLSLRRIA